MDATTEFVVIPATITSDGSDELKHAVLSYKAWRLAELCDSTYSAVAPVQGAHLEIDVDDATQDVGCESGDFIVLMAPDTVNGGLEVLLACDDVYVLAVLEQSSGLFDLMPYLINCKIDQRDDQALDEIRAALHSAAV